MKKYAKMFLMGATALFAASCTEADLGNEFVAPGRPVTLQASIESSGTRAAVDAGKTIWQAGDEIAVRLSDDSNMQMTAKTISDDKTSATFTGYIVGDGKLQLPTVAVYPYSEKHNLTDGSTKIYMPDTYTVTDNATTNMVMKADLDANGSGTFKHLAGVIQFKIGMDYVPTGAAQFRFTTPDKQNITGEFLVADGKITATSGDGSKSSVTIKFNAAQIVDNVLTVNVPLPVGTYVGYKIDILDADGKNLMETFGKETVTNTVSRAKRVVMPKLTPVKISAGTEESEPEKMTWAAFCTAKGYDFGAASTSTDAITIDGDGVVITDWVDAWYGGSVSIKNVTFSHGATFTAKNDGVSGTFLVEDCTFGPCDWDAIVATLQDGSTMYTTDGKRLDNAGGGLCLDIDTKNSPDLDIVVKNSTFEGENDITLPRKHPCVNDGTNLKGRGHAVAINAIAGSGTAKSVEILGNTMTGLRGNCIQLYTFNYPIIVKDNKINSWGRNSSTGNKTDDDYAIRGTLGASGALYLTNNYFGMDEEGFGTGVNHIKVDNFTGNTDGNRVKGSYSDTPSPDENKVTINGENYDNIAAALAANPGITEIKLNEGTFELPSSLNGLTITGVEGETKVDWPESGNPTAYNDVTIENVTFNMTGANYTGFQHAGNITFKNCTFNGLMFGYGNSETYINCKFYQTIREYHMWTYGANAVYDGCYFEGVGRFLHLYNEMSASNCFNVVVRNCHFKSTSAAADKAALNVKNTNSSFNVTIENCTTEGLFKTTFDTNGLWMVDGSGSANINITVDGTKCYPTE